jgi:histidyl-tRNA synthetase
MEYAHRRQIPFVLLAGKDEMETGTVAIKDMKTGVQTICPSGDLITMLAP